MTTVPAVGTTTGTSSAGSTASASLDYSAFLKLFIAQLKNQDPTQPMDSSQFVVQLATFSQVEQAYSTNSKLDSLLTANALSIGDQVIGRTLTSADGSVSGTVASVKITSDGAVATLTSGKTITLDSGVTIAPAAS
ncbi:MAG: flagellar hook assembly protein FlgD [Rhizobiales bacterium]|nr:flagellar hook assembly protein FlgD [Hyphomicrobiales bacterium]